MRQKVKAMAVPYTPVHYLLMGVSGFVFFSFVTGLVYLCIREKRKGALARKQYLRSLLQKRRKAISGRPRGPTASFSDESTAEWQVTSASGSPRFGVEKQSVETLETPIPTSS